MKQRTLPEIKDWPYRDVSTALVEFRSFYGYSPAVLWVGIDLWILLRASYDSDAFTMDDVPIRADRTGILCPHEFFFSGR